MSNSIQPLSAKKGEVAYRAALSKQHCSDTHCFDKEYTQEEMKKIIDEKLTTHRNDFIRMSQRFPLSPFLEIGAGYGQTSLVLTNEFAAQGYALDIALAPLASVKDTAARLEYKKLPRLLVADAEKLPFADNSFPFVFCFQTLHHFPLPKKVIEEAHRVLMPGGVFYFGEEPIGQQFGLRIWNRPTKLRWWERILKAMLILPFLSKIGKTEIDHGILEEAFSMREWKEALDIFPEGEASINPFPFGFKGVVEKKQNKWLPPNLSARLCMLEQFFTGGGISAVARKKGTLPKNKNILPLLVCPDCKRKLIQSNSKKTKSSCPKCKSVFPVNQQVNLVLPPKLLHDLYPDSL